MCIRDRESVREGKKSRKRGKDKSKENVAHDEESLMEGVEVKGVDSNEEGRKSKRGKKASKDDKEEITEVADNENGNDNVERGHQRKRGKETLEDGNQELEKVEISAEGKCKEMKTKGGRKKKKQELEYEEGQEEGTGEKASKMEENRLDNERQEVITRSKRGSCLLYTSPSPRDA